jgi:nitrilase
MKIASIQMVANCDLHSNLLSAEKLIGQAADQGCDLAVLPEYFCLLGRNDQDKLRIQENYGDGPIQEQLSTIAQSKKIAIVAGTLPISTGNPDRVFNSSIVFDANGAQLFRYDKIHLFSFSSRGESYDESKTLYPGNQPASFDLNDGGETWRFGLSVCYDLRFPEMYRAIGEVDAHIIPAAFTFTTGKVHWEILLRARAIENQCYVIASAQGGTHENGRQTWGHSMIIDPWGTICSVLEHGEGLISYELSKTDLQEIRNKLPALKHRTLK